MGTNGEFSIYLDTFCNLDEHASSGVNLTMLSSISLRAA